MVRKPSWDKKKPKKKKEIRKKLYIKKKEKKEISKKLYIKEEKEEIPVENTIYEFTPSRTGDKGLGKTPEDLKQLYKDAVAIKKHLETRLNSQDPKFLSNSVVTVVRLVARFNRESRDMPFNWKTEKFQPPHNWMKSYLRLKYPSPDGNSVTCSDGNGARIKTKNDVCVTKQVGMVEPIEDPNCLTLCGLRRHLARATPSPSADLLEVKGHAWIPHLLDANKNCAETCDLSLNEEEKKIWHKFKKFDEGTPEVKNFKFIEEGKRSIELDHPIVGLIGNFAVVAFNKACQMHVKKDVHNNLHDFEVLECKYLKFAKAYYFYMTIEAIEEGNLGVYETKVVCNNDGGRTLSKFLLTNRTPAGTKAMAISFFSCVRSICKSLHGIVSPKVDRLYAIRKCVRGPNKAYAEIDRLLLLKNETLRGLRQVLSLGPPLFFPQECIRTSNPDGWSHPDDNLSQMVRRAKGTSCRGYDYDKPTLHWQVFQLR